MDSNEAQSSCWGVTAWAVIVFLGAFTVFSLFSSADSGNGNVAVAEQEQQ